MKKRRTWALAVTVLTVVALVIFVLSCPRLYSPRMDALEPTLKTPAAPLDDFRKVAAQHDIPLELEPGEPGEPPRFVVPLDGTMWGKSLHLQFRKGDRGAWLLSYAVVVGRDGKEESWWRTRW